VLLLVGKQDNDDARFIACKCGGKITVSVLQGLSQIDNRHFIDKRMVYYQMFALVLMILIVCYSMSFSIPVQSSYTYHCMILINISQLLYNILGLYKFYYYQNVTYNVFLSTLVVKHEILYSKPL